MFEIKNEDLRVWKITNKIHIFTNELCEKFSVFYKFKGGTNGLY